MPFKTYAILSVKINSQYKFSTNGQEKSTSHSIFYKTTCLYSNIVNTPTSTDQQLLTN